LTARQTRRAATFRPHRSGTAFAVCPGQMKRIFASLGVLLAVVAVATTALVRKDVDPSRTELLRARYASKPTPSVDHSRFAQLRRKFTTPQQVTEACLSCHNGRHVEVMRSSHWNWASGEYIEGKGVRYVGKRNLLNNFCIGVAGSHQACNRCHIGYGWGEETFDLSDPRNVDCLACHDNSGTYAKGASAAGYPDRSVDLTKVAEQVGRPTKVNCGTCHFFSGGGNNVKHGDLEMALFDTTRDVDVHMASEGVDMSCVDCHTATKHQMKGKLYSISSMNRNRVRCEDCHTGTPHAKDILNEHTLKVACQTCHIPTYAKVNSTKLRWDWSTAGRLRDGKPYEEKDARGDDVYMSIKGSFQWGRNLKPEYAWFDGTATHYLLGDRIELRRPRRQDHPGEGPPGPPALRRSEPHPRPAHARGLARGRRGLLARLRLATGGPAGHGPRPPALQRQARVRRDGDGLAAQPHGGPPSPGRGLLRVSHPRWLPPRRPP
jgi:octaheme c-type cytochrome (tetrathionate reductase family)